MALFTYSKTEKRVGVVEQSTWGTIMADSTNFNAAANGAELACDSTIVDKDIKHRIADANHGSRYKISSEVVNDTKRAAPKISIKGPVKLKEIDLFLMAFFQNVTEGIGTPYSKIFTMAASQPDFTTSAGFFMTVIERSPVATQSTALKDCICNSLKLSHAPGELLMFEAELVGRGAATLTSNPSGTWTISANDYLYLSDIDRYRYNAGSWVTAHVPTDAGWELSLTQDVNLVGANGSGDFETFVLTNRGGEFTFNFTEDATVRAALQSAHANGTQVDFNVGFGNSTPGTDDGDFDVTLSGRVSNSDFDNKDVLGATAKVLLLGDDSTTTPVTVSMANTLDRTW